MTGVQVRLAREQQGLTQQQAGRRWHVSQAYLSLIERGHRRVPDRLARRLVRSDRNLVTALPMHVPKAGGEVLPTLLGALGYPGFEYLADPRSVFNPAAVVLAALKEPAVPARVAEALPWVLLRFPGLDWRWLMSEAKLANVQNRLGYLVSLAEELARVKDDEIAVRTLAAARATLEDARLAKEDTLGRALTRSECHYLRQHRTAGADHWNLLTELRADHLRYGD